MVDAEAMYKIVGRRPQKNGRRSITADIAMKGTDKMVIFVWDGFHLIDFSVLKKNNGKQAVDAIISKMKKWHVQPRNVVYDGNNMGGYIDGYIPGAREFLNNGVPLNGGYYNNLKSQCADQWAMRMNERMFGDDELLYSIDRKVGDRKVDGETFPDFIETMLMLEYLYLEGDLYVGNIIW